MTGYFSWVTPDVFRGVQESPPPTLLPDPQIPSEVTMPRTEEVERMIAVLEAEPRLGRGMLMDFSTGPCALGALLRATGVDNTTLAFAHGNPQGFSQEFRDRLYRWYRLDVRVAIALVQANDGTVSDRKHAVIHALHLAVRQQWQENRPSQWTQEYAPVTPTTILFGSPAPYPVKHVYAFDSLEGKVVEKAPKIQKWGMWDEASTDVYMKLPSYAFSL